ncbi:HNH endonuclease, partial [Janibacter sp. RAF20_2_2]
MDLTAPLDTLDATGVTGMIERLRELGGPVDEAEAIDEIAALERLKSAAAAAQARVTAALRERRLAREMDAGMPAAERGRGLGDEIGLARRESATLGSRHLGLARALVAELPCTLAHLAAGTVSEWGATLLAKETAVLDPDDRRRIDAELDDRLADMTPRQ